MNTDTGEIIGPDVFAALKQEEPEKAKKFVEIPHAFKDELIGMNRKERRRWYRQNKKQWLKALQKERSPNT